MLKVVAHLAPLVALASIAALMAAGSFSTRSPVLITLYLAALGLAVWARRSFPAGAFRATPDPAGAAVIRTGPYRFVRHPMYSAGLLLVWSAAAARLSPWTVGLGAVVTAVVGARVVWEERLLRAAFPDYAAYAQSTRAVIPFLI